MTKRKKLPQFKSQKREQAFWLKHDSTDYVDWTKARKVGLTNLKPSVQTISLRLPQSLLDQLRRLANKRDVPYQSLLKIFLAEKIREEGAL